MDKYIFNDNVTVGAIGTGAVGSVNVTRRVSQPFKIAISAGDFGGKDTVLDILQFEHNSSYDGLSFSDGLKMIGSDIFPWLDLDYLPSEKESKIVFHNPDTDVEWTARKVWEALDILAQIDPETFMRALKKEESAIIQEGMHNREHIRLCIKDIRRPAELAYCKANGYKILFIDTDDDRWLKKKKEDQSLIIQFREEIKAAADYTYFNKKDTKSYESKVPMGHQKWHENLANWVSETLYHIGDTTHARKVFNTYVKEQ